MHKITILTSILIGVVFTFSGHAATKCVALNSSSTCTGTPTTSKVDWTATCNSIPITGVGVCSSTSGAIGDTADTLETTNTTDANKYCWCKMTSPAVSRFVYASSGGSAAHCSYGCAYSCAYGCVANAVNAASFRAGLFGNMK